MRQVLTFMSALAAILMMSQLECNATTVKRNIHGYYLGASKEDVISNSVNKCRSPSPANPNEMICGEKLANSNTLSFNLRFTDSNKLFDIKFIFLSGEDPDILMKNIGKEFNVDIPNPPLSEGYYHVDNNTTLQILPSSYHDKDIYLYSIKLYGDDIVKEQEKKDLEKAREAAPAPKF